MSTTTQQRIDDRAWRKRMVRSGVRLQRYRQRDTRWSPARVEQLTSTSSIPCLDKPEWETVEERWIVGCKRSSLPCGIVRDTYVSDFERGSRLVGGDATAWRNGEANCQAVTR